MKIIERDFGKLGKARYLVLKQDADGAHAIIVQDCGATHVRGTKVCLAHEVVGRCKNVKVTDKALEVLATEYQKAIARPMGFLR